MMAADGGGWWRDEWAEIVGLENIKGLLLYFF